MLVRFLTISLLLLVAAGCSSKKSNTALEDFKSKSRNVRVEDLNSQIAASASNENAVTEYTYLLGPGDLIELKVFEVKELDTQVRVNGRGEIIIPLLGTIEVGGKSISEVEDGLRMRLTKDFMQDPQVSVFVNEYRSQQITVLGAVVNPSVYNIRKSRSVFEVLSLAGGLSDKASNTLRVKTNQKNPETGEVQSFDLVLSIRAMLNGADEVANIRLSGGDSVIVPEAGYVYVEGAVNKPGAYRMTGDTTVLKAVALAGGIPWIGKESNLRVVRDVDGKPESLEINISAVRNQKEDDMILRDGDIVIVSYSTLKRAYSGFWGTLGRLVGYRI